jgi:hypothetical protein
MTIDQVSPELAA